MKRFPIDSEHLKAVGYDGTNRLLEVEFYNGQIYQYLNVPELAYTSFLSSTAKDSYYESFIHQNYDSTMITNKSSE